MEHEMKLDPESFESIKSNSKIIEIRLYDEKRKNVWLGDTIKFSKLPSLEEKLSVEVSALFIVGTFSELIYSFPMTDFGYPHNYDKNKLLDEIYQVYTKEEERKYKVLGIKMNLK